MSRELRRIEKLFQALVAAPKTKFPPPQGRLSASRKKGVYLIFSPRGAVLHVGCTPRANRGIEQRLKNHLASGSSFVNKYLKGNGSKLRSGYSFSYVEVAEPRTRMLLEAYSVGHLCPRHIGHGDAAP